jgi:hypothetical protein
VRGNDQLPHRLVVAVRAQERALYDSLMLRLECLGEAKAVKAARQSAGRSANLEASAQLSRALEEIKKLPTGVERDNLELNIQIALIGPTIALQGFAAAAVADVSSHAIELCRALDNDPRIFPALYAR